MRKETAMFDGVVNDRLNIWADTSRTLARGAFLRRMQELAGFTAKGFAEQLDINRTVLYQERVKVSQRVLERLRDLTRIIDNAFVLFEGDEDKVIKWLFSQNRRFYNMTPFSMAMAGKGDTIYQFQENLRFDQGQGPQTVNDRDN